MRPQREQKGRGVFYSRDSGGKHEQTPSQYVEWARRTAAQLGVRFDGTPERIDEMMKSGAPVNGDLFFDYCVQGHVFARPALDKLREIARRDATVSHIFIPRRDRLARPDDPIDAVQLETEFRQLGITIVLMDKVLVPLSRHRRRDLGETIVAYMEYEESGKFRQDLGKKMIFAQLRLAKMGYATGGRPPFGFRRWLIKEDGTQLRQLTEGEVVRQPGCHVVWLPGPETELALIRRILEMLERMPATRVAAVLTAEGIPSPDAGRMRKDNGIKHVVSGDWHATTITNIARNPLVIAVVRYGLRSLGDTCRISRDGPRGLEDSDFREKDGKPKVIRNSDEIQTKAPARFEPLVDLERHTRLLATLDERGGTQRGKPRSRDPDRNPLGGRIFDLACSWPMYRNPYSKSFRYTCGLYQQSHCQRCRHNHIEGLVAARFVLAAIRQRLLRPGMMKRLEQKLRERAEAEGNPGNNQTELARTRIELETVRGQKDQASWNLALAATPEQHKAISAVFDNLVQREVLLATDMSRLERASAVITTGDEVEGALAVAHRLGELASDSANLGNLGRLFAALDVQLYLRFQPVQKKKRVEQKLSGGVLTFGAVPPPIQKYAGPTGRRALSGSGLPCNAEISFSGGGEKSSGNVSRGDRI